ncbi:MAG: GNAT family N-acetyltransferase [Chloroflexi bacterium]|nr:GNAT family N-acetyltransferase [Chloroflexota bacterium]
MHLTVHRLDEDRIPDFFHLHHADNDAGWCFCVAWWVRAWQGWSERTSLQNRTLREALFRVGQLDGYLLYADDEPVGWCQVGLRDRLGKLMRQFELEQDPETWAITCFLIAPDFRGRGVASFLLDAVLNDLEQRGVQRVEAFPKRGGNLDEYDLWNGPEAMFLAAGFVVVDDDPARPVLALELG